MEKYDIFPFRLLIFPRKQHCSFLRVLTESTILIDTLVIGTVKDSSNKQMFTFLSSLSYLFIMIILLGKNG